MNWPRFRVDTRPKRKDWGYPQAQAYVGREALWIADETLRSGESLSAIARRHGVAPNLLYRWCRLMTEGGAVAVRADDDVTTNGGLRRLEERVRDLKR